MIWTVLGGLAPSWAVLRPSWAVLGRLEPSWGRLGAILEPSWSVHGSSWRCLGPSWSVLRLLLVAMGRASTISSTASFFFFRFGAVWEGILWQSSGRLVCSQDVVSPF